MLFGHWQSILELFSLGRFDQSGRRQNQFLVYFAGQVEEDRQDKRS